MSASGAKSKQKGPYDPQVPCILSLLLAVIQTVNMIMTMAMNCSSTAKPPKLLRCVARAPAPHVDEAEEEHHCDGADGDQDCNVRHEIGRDRATFVYRL